MRQCWLVRTIIVPADDARAINWSLVGQVYRKPTAPPPDPEESTKATVAAAGGKKKNTKKQKKKKKDGMKPAVETASDGWGINGINLTVNRGQLVCIVGTSTK